MFVWLAARGRRVCCQSICRPCTNRSHPDQNQRARHDEETETSQHRLSSCHWTRGISAHQASWSVVTKCCQNEILNLTIAYSSENNRGLYHPHISGFYLAHPKCYKMCRCYLLFFFNCSPEDELSQNVPDWSSPNVQDRYACGGHHQFCDRLRDIAMVTDFWHESAKFGIPTFILCADVANRMEGCVR